MEDDELYPEAYRKSDYVKGSNHEIPDPFRIGKIQEIYIKSGMSASNVDAEEVMLKVRKFYRYIIFILI
jgi:DNA (cytosine-5)-methyltransferase 1